MNKEQFEAGLSPAKKSVITQLMMLSQITQMLPETLALSALIHAVTGAALLGQEEELVTRIMPHIEEMKRDAENLLAELESQKETDEIMDFFDKTEIIA